MEDPRVRREVKARIARDGGMMIGTEGDGYDIAAFGSETTAMRFLNRYFEGDLDGPLGVYEMSEITL